MGRKKRAGNLENPRSADRNTWEKWRREKAFVFIPVLLLDKKLRGKNYLFPTKKRVCSLYIKTALL